MGMIALVEKVHSLNEKYQYEQLTIPIRRKIAKELMRATRACLGSEKAKRFYVCESPPMSGRVELRQKGLDYEVPSISLNLRDSG